jgi:hypothetical protein
MWGLKLPSLPSSGGVIKMTFGNSIPEFSELKDDLKLLPMLEDYAQEGVLSRRYPTCKDSSF